MISAKNPWRGHYIFITILSLCDEIWKAWRCIMQRMCEQIDCGVTLSWNVAKMWWSMESTCFLALHIWKFPPWKKAMIIHNDHQQCSMSSQLLTHSLIFNCLLPMHSVSLSAVFLPPLSRRGGLVTSPRSIRRPRQPLSHFRRRSPSAEGRPPWHSPKVHGRSSLQSKGQSGREKGLYFNKLHATVSHCHCTEHQRWVKIMTFDLKDPDWLIDLDLLHDLDQFIYLDLWSRSSGKWSLVLKINFPDSWQPQLWPFSADMAKKVGFLVVYSCPRG